MLNIAFAFLASVIAIVAAQNPTIKTTNWQGYLNNASGVLQSLSPASDTSFDFSPTDYFQLRNGVGNYHTGDLTMRWRVKGQAAWEEVDTAAQRNISPRSSSMTNGSLLHSNFDNVFPDAAQYLQITRDWAVYDGDLILKATVANTNKSTVEIGAFGFPIEFNNIFTNRTAEQTTANCVLVDPYIGLDGGYLQVTRLTGTGPNMIITPFTNTSRFEAWRFLSEDTDGPTAYQSQVFEGLYSWQTLSLAYAENEWNATTPWNAATSLFLSPGESLSFALRFSIAQNVYDIESAVASTGTPVAVGLPGFVMPVDMNYKLFLDSSSAVNSISSAPSGVLKFTATTAPNSSWKAYNVAATDGSYGRVRVNIEYADGKTQSVHYYITDTTLNTATKFGQWLFSKQWYTDASDPFRRAPSIISYDNQVGAQVLQEPRVWIAGISDEGGAGSFEAAAMKSSVHPDAAEISKLEEMAITTVWGTLQDTNNTAPGVEYGVKRSVFFYEPSAVPGYTYSPSINWGGAWDQSDAYAVWRAYDYVHVSALYWALYSAECASPGILTKQNATWYLLQAYHTIMETQATDSNGAPITAYGNDGLMCETVWLSILRALQAENLTMEFDSLQAAMKSRQQAWSTMVQPYGSEMAWDSTGQEGVYLWSKYFNDTTTVTKTLDSIRGYMPTVAHWGWNGNARRYWDFLYAGKIERIERMIHHYGSGLNALPMLDSYKYNPNPSSMAAIYDLRIGYGGNMGPLSNINANGFGAQAFHSWPDTMAWEAYSGDYGPNYLGHILGSATYLFEHPDFGWISMGGNLQQSGNTITVQPKDSVRRRVYVASAGLFVEYNAGTITKFTYDTASHGVTIELGPDSGSDAKSAVLTYEDTLGTGVKLNTGGLKQSGGGYVVTIPGSIDFTL